MDKAADIVPQVEQIMGKVDTLLTTLNTLAATRIYQVLWKTPKALRPT